MKKIDRIILWFLGLGFPVVVGLLIWAYSIIDQKTIDQVKATGERAVTHYTNGPIENALGIFFIIWLTVALFTLVRLLVNSDYREIVLSKVARVKERDEREVEISGYAAKFTFFANLSLLVFLLFFSSINLNLKKYNQDLIDDKGEHKHGFLSMGFSMHGYDEKALVVKNDQTFKEVTYSELPLSKSGIIILLIVWQMGMYHFSARKKLNY